ncbi:MAG TPA: glycosyltransferase family 39 protein [Chthoniobacterales bacterium]|jgi:4-amino-4-deoxy-L-arabinose transferase-like glycosyltransferase
MPVATERSTVLPRRDGKIWLVLFVVALGFLSASLLRTINVPWVEEDNVFGAAYAQAACNNLRAGLSVTAGVPATFYVGPLPIPPDAYYVHHPVFVPLLITASVMALGEKEWVVKLVPICCSILSAWFLWLLVGDAINKRAAAFVVAFFVTLPMELHYGDLVDYEPCLVMWMLAALVCLWRWKVRHRSRWIILAALCCGCALWTDWPGYLFTVSVAVSFLLKKEKSSRRFALLLLGMVAICGTLFLLQIRYVNPDAWRDLWNAMTMRLGSGHQPGSSANSVSAGPRFGFAEWLSRIFQSLDQDYLRIGWALVLGGAVYLFRNRKSPGARWLGWAALRMAAAGIPYLVILRNWSFVHDFASFFVIGSIAICGGLGIETIWQWLDGKAGTNSLRRGAAILTTIFLVSLAWAGFIRAEEQRSQFLMLDGVAPEPDNLIPDLGRYLGGIFPANTTILCNFDPSYSPLSYYAKREIVRNLASAAEWNDARSDTSQSMGGIVWLGAPSAGEILQLLPKEEVAPAEIDGIRFAVWKPAR